MGEQNEKSNRRCFQEKSNSRCFQYGRSNHHRDRNIYFCPNPTCLRGWHQGMPVASTAYLKKLYAFRQTVPPKLIAGAAFHCGRALPKIFSRHPRLQARDRAC
jgi:hypothetical protein